MAYIRCSGNIGGSLKVRTASGNPCTFETNLADKLVSLKAAILASGGGGTPSTPNPIVGYSSLNLTHCGVNWWDEEWENGYFDLTTGEPTSSTTISRSKNFIPVQMGTYYYVSGGKNHTILFYDKQQNYINYSSHGTSGHTITITSGVGYIKFAFVGTTYDDSISINYPSTEQTYHAYTGTTDTIALGSTVYGGELDVTTGVLTITHGIFTIDGNTNMSPNGSTANTSHFVIAIPNKAYSYDNFISDKFAYLTPYQDIEGYASGRINSSNIEFFLPSSVAQTMAAGKAWFANNVTTIVYELATPIEIDVSELSVETLMGINNIFHDCNGDTEVKYLHKA